MIGRLRAAAVAVLIATGSMDPAASPPPAVGEVSPVALVSANGCQHLSAGQLAPGTYLAEFTHTWNRNSQSHGGYGTSTIYGSIELEIERSGAGNVSFSLGSQTLLGSFPPDWEIDEDMNGSGDHPVTPAELISTIDLAFSPSGTFHGVDGGYLSNPLVWVDVHPAWAGAQDRDNGDTTTSLQMKLGSADCTEASATLTGRFIDRVLSQETGWTMSYTSFGLREIPVTFTKTVDPLDEKWDQLGFDLAILPVDDPGPSARQEVRQGVDAVAKKIDGDASLLPVEKLCLKARLIEWAAPVFERMADQMLVESLAELRNGDDVGLRPLLHEWLVMHRALSLLGCPPPWERLQKLAEPGFALVRKLIEAGECQRGRDLDHALTFLGLGPSEADLIYRRCIDEPLTKKLKEILGRQGANAELVSSLTRWVQSGDASAYERSVTTLRAAGWDLELQP